jgi:hemolysin III
MSQPTRPEAEITHEKFSLPLFLATVAATLACLLAVVRFGFPGAWSQQVGASWGSAVVAFLAVSLLNCFVEYFFHRYLLHTSAIPIVSRLYRQHTLHHSLTRIGRKRTADGRSLLVIENVFPIIEPSQGEASFFPWYTLAVFAAVISPILAVAQILLPSFPWFLSGFGALAVSLVLYELFHAANHWPMSVWEPLIQSRVWGWFWRPAYSFHLRHHAVIDCNESISGFFGLPLADWALRTCMIPKTVYADGEDWSEEKFQRPRPRLLIRILDRWAGQSMRRGRAAAAAGTVKTPARENSLDEKVVVGLTYGVGLAVSIAGLTLLIVFASLRGDAWHVVSFAVFGLALVTLHTVLTLYHAWRSERGRWLIRRLGHVAGFLLVAGTYTPFLLTNLRGPLGWTALGAAWGLCGAGAVFQLVWGERFRFSRALRWLTAGWLLAMVLKPMMHSVPAGGLWLLVAGGLCYGISVAFPRWRELRYPQAFRQGLVVMGGACHILAVLLFLLPAAS